MPNEICRCADIDFDRIPRVFADAKIGFRISTQSLPNGRVAPCAVFVENALIL